MCVMTSGARLDEARRNELLVAETGLSLNSTESDISNVSSRKSFLNGNIDYNVTPAGIANALRSYLRQSNLFDSNSDVALLVLLTDYFEESLRLLDYSYNTQLFTTPRSGGSSRNRVVKNKAQSWQEQGLFSTSPGEMKTILRLLEVHQALYQVCVDSFMLTYTKISIHY